jgi:hypothetical protein
VHINEKHIEYAKGKHREIVCKKDIKRVSEAGIYIERKSAREKERERMRKKEKERKREKVHSQI